MPTESDSLKAPHTGRICDPPDDYWGRSNERDCLMHRVRMQRSEITALHDLRRRDARRIDFALRYIDTLDEQPTTVDLEHISNLLRGVRGEGRDKTHYGKFLGAVPLEEITDAD